MGPRSLCRSPRPESYSYCDVLCIGLSAMESGEHGVEACGSQGLHPRCLFSGREKLETGII